MHIPKYGGYSKHVREPLVRFFAMVFFQYWIQNYWLNIALILKIISWYVASLDSSKYNKNLTSSKCSLIRGPQIDYFLKMVYYKHWIMCCCKKDFLLKITILFLQIPVPHVPDSWLKIFNVSQFKCDAIWNFLIFPQLGVKNAKMFNICLGLSYDPNRQTWQYKKCPFLGPKVPKCAQKRICSKCPPKSFGGLPWPQLATFA